MTKKEMLEEKEKTFQKAWDLYWHGISSYDKESLDKQWKIMFQCVYDACYNEARKLVRGLINSEGESIQVQELDGKACEAAIKIMLKIKEGTRPKAISSYVYLWTYGEIFGIKEQRWDQAPDYSSFDNVAYYTEGKEAYLCENMFK